VLYVSGYTDDSELLAGGMDEAAAFLAKPFMPGDLVLAVHALLTDAERQGAPVRPSPSSALVSSA